MAILQGPLTTEDLRRLEKEAIAMSIENARVHLKTKTEFSDAILYGWIDHLVKTYPESLLAVSRRAKRPPALK